MTGSVVGPDVTFKRSKDLSEIEADDSEVRGAVCLSICNANDAKSTSYIVTLPYCACRSREPRTRRVEDGVIGRKPDPAVASRGPCGVSVALTGARTVVPIVGVLQH